MRTRVVMGTIAVIVGALASATVWRQVFPFSDRLVEFLPEEPIAYVHVNITAGIRRALDRQITVLQSQVSDDGISVLRAVLRARDVHELGLVWLPAATDSLVADVAGVPSSSVVLLIGQRASERLDVSVPASVVIGGISVRIAVVRTRAHDSSRNMHTPMRDALSRRRSLPVQAAVRPRTFPFRPLEASLAKFPELVVAAGMLTSDGWILRPQPWIPTLMPPWRREIRGGLHTGSVVARDVPVQDLLAAVDAPLHRDLFAAVRAVLPDVGDIVIRREGVAARLSGVDSQDDRTWQTIRAMIARMVPSVRARRFDGIDTASAVADPASVEIVDEGRDRWIVRRDGTSVGWIEQRDGALMAATSEFMRDEMNSGTSRSTRVPSACVPRLAQDRGMMISLSFHPQIAAILSFNRANSWYAACGGFMGNFIGIAE